GNVRELRNVVERSVARGRPEAAIAEVVIDPFASPWSLAGEGPGAPPPEAPPATQPKAAAPLGGILSDPARSFDLRAALRRVEHDLLKQALEAQRHNQRATARQLGLTYDQLRGRLRKHGLLGDDPEPQEDQVD